MAIRPRPNRRTWSAARPNWGFRRWRSSVDDCTVDVLGHTGFPGMAIGVVPAHTATVVLATNRLHVDGTPRGTEEMWLSALAAAHRALHS